MAEDPRDLALYLRVDRSGSMRAYDTQVRLALISDAKRLRLYPAVRNSKSRPAWL